MGFLNINKPAGLTSHDVVARVRRFFRQQVGKIKVGHAGTLDPLATGVLILCVGDATRLSDYVMHGTKQYRAVVHMGITTETYDAEGETIASQDASHITQDELQAILPQFTGDIEQVPPMYSAIKQGGKKLYELAREGKTVERPARHITIHNITLIDSSPPRFTLDVVCSAGTYIRSLAYDIGEALEVGAHLAGLTRTRSGTFSLDEAINLDDFLEADDWQQYLTMPYDALGDYSRITLTEEQAAALKHGKFISRSADLPDPVMAYMPDKKLGAILETRNTDWKPRRVFLK